jgi:hypothetical protein
VRFSLATRGVPIVPIVIRNAGEITRRNARIAQSGTVEVTVHEPVPTAGWARGDIEPWLNRTRQLYIDTLDDWPASKPDGSGPRRSRTRRQRITDIPRLASAVDPSGTAILITPLSMVLHCRAELIEVDQLVC